LEIVHVKLVVDILRNKVTFSPKLSCYKFSPLTYFL
jgi:hypothetical protein